MSGTSPSSATIPANPEVRAHQPPLPQSQALFDRIEALDLDQGDLALGFAARLARENLWTDAHARAVVGEYKRFLYLMAISDDLLTPSEAVDAAWHLHLCYSRSYWDDLCGRVLGGLALHHEPTEGGESEEARFRTAYRRTLDAYRKVFAAEPPPDIWPDETERFEQAGTARTVSTREYWIVKRPPPARERALALVAAAGLAGALFWLHGALVPHLPAALAGFGTFLVMALFAFTGGPLISFALTGKWNKASVSADGGCGGCGGCGG